MLMACEIVLSRFLSISLPTLKISLAFIPLVIIALLYGPLWSAAAAGICDFIGAMLFPFGEFFPGFTLTATLVGLTYGLFLYKKSTDVAEEFAPEITTEHHIKPLRAVLCAFIVTCVLQLLLDTLWLNIMYGDAFFALIPPRLVKSLVMLIVQSVVILFIGKNLHKIKLVKT